MTLSTNPQKIQEFLTRGVEHVYPSQKFLEKELTSNRRLSVYVGYDPTAPTLHIGHGITMLKLRQFQELGHQIIFLIGDFTGMVGDPTDKSATRQKLTREAVLENAKEYQRQASAILDFHGENPAEIRYNSEWSDNLTGVSILELASNFTVPRLLERDMFQKRLEEGKTIYLHEFLYPVLQAYDMYAMKVDGQIGGNDQTFNMLAGRDLIVGLDQRESFVISMKLLVDPSGKKMGKSEGNMVALSDSPEDMFGKVMSWTDGMIIPAFELCTRVPMPDIQEMDVAMKSGSNPRDYKLRLAYEITKLFLGVAAAEKGQDHFASVIQSHEAPDEVAEIKPSAYDIVTVLVEATFADSKSDAKRAIDGGGVKVNDAKVESYDQTVKSGDVVQKGKRFFVKVT